MTAYILSMLAAALLCAVVELLAPKGEGGRLASGVRMVAGLFLLVALLAPLRAGLDVLSDFVGQDIDTPAEDAEGYESAWEASILALGHAELTAWVTETLTTEFGIAADCVEVVPVWGESDTVTPPLSEVCIVLSGRAMAEDPAPIEAYFAAALGCPCRVSVTW